MIITEIHYFFSKIIRFQAPFKDTVEFTCALEFKISSQLIHRGQKFTETMEAFQQKRAEFIARGIRSFDTETLYVFLEWVRSNGHKLDRITGMAV